MKLKLTLLRPGGDAVDLSVVVEPSTTVGDVALQLQGADPSRNPSTQPSSDLGLRVHPARDPGAARLLAPESTVDDASLASGLVVSIAPGTASASRAVGEVGAVISVIQGPDRGKTFDLPIGASSVGRDASNRVSLSDPLVSKTHLRINVTDSIEVIDAGSSNGTLVNDQQVDRVTLVDGDVVAIGDTVLSISARARQAASESGGVVNFNRSPRLDPIYPGTKIKAPEPPEKQRPPRLPIIALIAPLVVGAVFLAVNPNNPASLVFIALSPLLMIATFIDNRIQTRKQWRQASADFQQSVTAVGTEIDELHSAERAGRLAEAASAGELIVAAAARSNLLWTRRPEHGAFLAVRLGMGGMPSRHEIEMPGQRRGTPEMWSQVTELQGRLAIVAPVPAVENLAVAGSLGVGGPLPAARAVARGLVVQLAALHSPAELVLVGLASTASSREWDWLKWLPHTGSAFSPLSANALSTGGPAASATLSELEELIAVRTEALRENAGRALPVVVVVVEDDAPVERARMVAIAESGPVAGVHLLWIAPSVARIPAACRTFIDIPAHAGESVAGYVHTGYGVQPVDCESIAEGQAADFARSLAPVLDASARVDDASDLPRSVSFLQLVGSDVGNDADAVVARWRETHSILTGDFATPPNPRFKPNLRAVFGQAANEPLALDLRADGPHALVGGTTGSGKSEFLQAWVLGLAATHSPQRVTFLFVDYKGGAAFAECVELPHTVGLVTDLSPHLVRRALTSLRAELRYREHLFNRKKVKDIVEFERTGDPEVPPSLVIVVDEFAALATEVPEFVDGVVDVAQRGRSLGLHLILATQRPAGVIRDNLRANTNLRVALRMADEADSTDVLGTPLAAGFDPAIPGRAAVKTGPGRIRVFQSGYASGWTSDVPEPNPVAIEELRFGPPLPWVAPADPEADERRARAAQGPTDIKRVVTVVRGAAKAAGIGAPRKPWLPELAGAYDFSKLPNKRTDAEIVLGVVDDAASQSQPIVSYLPDRDGNMAIIGTGGSGKSTALRTIAIASAVTMRGGPVQVYGLDFAAGGIQMLERLPHVGSIVSGEDDERVARLLRWLRDLIDDRAVRYAEARASTIVEYRRLASKPEEPRILLLLDGMGAFREAYESNISSPWFAVFSQIATDGRGVGVHVVVTGDRAGSIPTSLSSSIQRRLVLRLANVDDYSMLGVPADVLSPMSPPGRGILDDLETQVAVLGRDPNVAVQARELDALAEAATKAGVVAAPPIERLAEDIPIESLKPKKDEVLIGISDDTLQPVGIDPTGAFVVAGPPGSGRSTALATIGAALARTRPDTKRYLLSTRRSAIGRTGAWTVTADSPETLDRAVAALAKLVDGPALAPGSVAVFLENLADFTGTSVEYELERIVKALLKAEQFVVAEAETSTWAQAYSLGQPIRAGRRGLLVQPDEGDGDVLLNTSLGRIRRGSLPPGRGYLVGGGRARRLQVARAE
ncbi:MAG: FtsK/SpoIIIE domain-containing protein [Pseudolysinimonas sp.]